MFLKQLNNTDFWQNFNIFVTSEHSHSKENLTLRRKGGRLTRFYLENDY